MLRDKWQSLCHAILATLCVLPAMAEEDRYRDGRQAYLEALDEFVSTIEDDPGSTDADFRRGLSRLWSKIGGKPMEMSLSVVAVRQRSDGETANLEFSTRQLETCHLDTAPVSLDKLPDGFARGTLVFRGRIVSAEGNARKTDHLTFTPQMFFHPPDGDQSRGNSPKWKILLRMKIEEIAQVTEESLQSTDPEDSIP